MTLGEYLLQARRDRQFNIRELAEKSGVSTAEISRIETGHRRSPSPRSLKALADALVLDYAALMQLAGYIDEVHEKEKTIEHVFRDEATGEIVDVTRGVKEMFRKDADWANVAFRVSRDLGEADRQMLTVLAKAYLDRNSQPAKSRKARKPAEETGETEE